MSSLNENGVSRCGLRARPLYIAVWLFVVDLLRRFFLMQKNYQGKKLWEKLLFSPMLSQKNATKKIAYIAVITAVLTVGNTLLEIKFSDVQFSFTLILSMLAGIILGGGSGFCACIIGDALGFIINSWGYVYMPWVGLTSGVTALMGGIIFHLVNFDFKGGFILKLFLICLSSFLLGTVAINTTGFYFYNYNMGFSTAVINYVKDLFGGEVSYLGYLLYRLIFKGQIFNCILNYALLFAVVPAIVKLPFLKN